jgi:hypothetical protein
MQKVLIVGIIVLPIVTFIAIFGNDIMITFIENENAQIEQETEMMNTVVEGSGWGEGSGWSFSSE